jgi:predicted aconitase
MVNSVAEPSAAHHLVGRWVDRLMQVEVTVKLGIVVIGTMLGSISAYAVQLAQTASADTVQQLIPAAALTGTSGALVWVVKQVVGGKLVHRDPAEASERLRVALERAAELLERAGEREDRLIDHLSRAERTN